MKKNTSNQLLLIFLRNPVLGKTKTRLAKTIGNEKALEIYLKLLTHTLQTASKLKNVNVRLCFTEHLDESDFFKAYDFENTQQKGDDLGLRMQHEFDKGFAEGYAKVVVIGTDLPTLATNHLENTFEALNTFDVVLGPAADGGYYLLGLKKTIPKLFHGKAWGTETVLRETLLDLEKNKVYLLETLNDIDTEEDLAAYPAYKKLLNK